MIFESRKIERLDFIETKKTNGFNLCKRSENQNSMHAYKVQVLAIKNIRDFVSNNHHSHDSHKHHHCSLFRDNDNAVPYVGCRKIKSKKKSDSFESDFSIIYRVMLSTQQLRPPRLLQFVPTCAYHLLESSYERSQSKLVLRCTTMNRFLPQYRPSRRK